MSTAELRKKYRDYCIEYDRLQERYKKWYRKECGRLTAEWRKNPILIPRVRLPAYPTYRPPSPPFPDELMGLTWGAKTRAGTPCKLTSLYRSGRCKFHGGMSTGPTSAEGKKRSAANGFKPNSIRTSWMVVKSWYSERILELIKTHGFFEWGHKPHEDLTKPNIQSETYQDRGGERSCHA